jgi:patatin-like phospholipase/acyl hydrolase
MAESGAAPINILSFGRLSTSFNGNRLTALDGGGIRGYSSLQILEQVMLKIKDKLDLGEVPRPYEYFDLIGGTSTGG